jgi:hypothetical protein
MYSDVALGVRMRIPIVVWNGRGIDIAAVRKKVADTYAIESDTAANHFASRYEVVEGLTLSHLHRHSKRRTYQYLAIGGIGSFIVLDKQ